MGRLLDIVTPLHRRTNRDYLARMTDDKVGCMLKAKQYGMDYWDGDRRHGYGGYKYDGRWRPVAEKLIETYKLPPAAKILDVGCGKGFLLLEIKKLLPDCDVTGFDISEYAIANAPEDIRDRLYCANARAPFNHRDEQFDLAISLGCLHNLELPSLGTALKEIVRVSKNSYIMVESYRNEQELFNLQCWALTCESFFSINEWEWLFEHFGYDRDYEFIYFK